MARNVTGLHNDTEAVKKFREMLTERSNYFNEEPFPKNESNEEAHKRCSNIKDAKKYCPKRWEAAEKWWAAARMVIIKSILTFGVTLSVYPRRTNCKLCLSTAGIEPTTVETLRGQVGYTVCDIPSSCDITYIVLLITFKITLISKELDSISK